MIIVREERAMPGKPARLGKVQLEIMRILWRRGRATAREITEEMSRTQPVAHSTVQTLLRQLQAKGAVTYDVEDRTFVYRTLYQQSEVAESAARELLTRLFNGSVYSLMAHLLKHEEISDDDLARLRELIDREREP
jgi:BlaI family transcriptional regulator, penicillinase repressor